jgi:uncharacterized protein YbjT (DUF2867 family)
MKSALLAGATGLTGKLLLYSLLDSKEYSAIFILVRKEITIKDPRLTQIIFNYDNPRDYENLPNADILFCCLGTTIKKAGSQEAFSKVDSQYPIHLAKVCSEKKYKKFLLITALGANPNSRIFYNRVKGETEEKIKSFNFKEIYFCRPSLILGNRTEFRVGEQIGKLFAKFISPLLFGSLRKYRAIEALIIAKAMIKLASTSNQGVHIIESDELERLGRTN